MDQQRFMDRGKTQKHRKPMANNNPELAQHSWAGCIPLHQHKPADSSQLLAAVWCCHLSPTGLEEAADRWWEQPCLKRALTLSENRLK